MKHLDDLPIRDQNHKTDSRAESAFQNLISGTDSFLIQQTDRKDYGTDYQIEVIGQGQATNVRVHVQLKGTEKDLNADGSVSVQVKRTNLNYLLMHPYSFYVCYHTSTDSLLYCSAESVFRQYEHGGQDWSRQRTLTVNFSQSLTVEQLNRISVLSRSSTANSRDNRVAQIAAPTDDVPNILLKALPEVHVPDELAQASDMISRLYERGMDELISSKFTDFTALFGPADPATMYCYMSEINLGMAGMNAYPERIEAGIKYLRSELEIGRFQIGSLHYSIGNGLSAIGDETGAVDEYEAGITSLGEDKDQDLLAQCYKNAGSSYERLGKSDKALSYYQESLRFDPHLPEAHFALGNHYHRVGEYEQALEHFDKVTFVDGTLGKKSTIAGWRVNVLFNLDDGKGAFREINGLLGDASTEAWIWQWCAKQVAYFGRESTENASSAIAFWDRYLHAHPNCPFGTRELLAAKLYFRAHSDKFGVSYEEFKVHFQTTIELVHADGIAFLWDRLGHWAQDEANWEEAEFCFRKAYDLEGWHYGYCLGVALNFLGRCEESLPILLAQAEEIQPDDMSWFQVALACERLGQISDSVKAYDRSIKLNPKNEKAWFNLGGVHWNSGDRVNAAKVWRKAVDLFPKHELAIKLHRELPFVLLEPKT